MTLVSKLLEWTAGVKTKLIIYGSLFIAIVLFILRVYIKGKAEGRDSLKKAISEENEKIRRKWDNIDRTPTDFNSAIDGLRKRGNPKSSEPTP